jgi:hypothetical protein
MGDGVRIGEADALRRQRFDVRIAGCAGAEDVSVRVVLLDDYDDVIVC